MPPSTPLLGRCAASRSYILGLPHELLIEIIQLALFSTELSISEQHRAALKLIWVCRRFRQIALVYLYDALEVQIGESNVIDSWNDQLNTKRLYRALKENPSLRRFCRTLKMAVHRLDHGDGAAAELEMVTDMVLWLNGVKTLRINSSPAEFPDNWPIISTALESMPHLEALSVPRQLWDVVELPKLLDKLPCPPTLKLSGRFLDTVSLATPWFLEKSGTGLFNNLVVFDWDETPEDLSALLQWPGRLEHFSYLCRREMGWGTLWDANMLLFGWSPNIPSLTSIGRALEPHRSSLKSLTIGPPGKFDLDGFDLTEYGALEELTISKTAIGGDDEAHRAAKLVAPNLKSFRWEFAERCALTSLSDFFYSQRWLRAFIHAARLRGCPLQRIEIDYSPVAVFGDQRRREPHTFEYPWDVMDRMRSELQPAGIHFSYNPPSITRHQFNAVFDEWFVKPQFHTSNH